MNVALRDTLLSAQTPWPGGTTGAPLPKGMMPGHCRSRQTRSERDGNDPQDAVAIARLTVRPATESS